MEQWFFRITAYADQLLEDLALIDWPEKTKTIQRNWIGRSEGAEVLFRDEELDIDIPVFTTRPDTLFGATFFVLAPEHPFVEQLGTTRCAPTRRSAGARSVEERQTKEKDGVFTGHYVVNPVNGERIPVWVADYVLMDYGTGAIMAVPAHDERDREFAERYGLPIRPVIDEEDRRADRLRRVHRAARRRGHRRRSSSGCARRVAAPPRSRTACATGRSRASATGAARSRSSTARTTASSPVPEDQLPLVLPEVEDYRPHGQAAARLQRGVDQRAVPEVRQARAARGGHDGHVRRLVLVLPALLRPAQRPGAVGPAARRLLDARRPVHRRHRPRDGAPALLALLRQGAERLRPARASASRSSGCSTRAGCARAARRCRSRRGTSSAPTSWWTRTGRTPSATYILFMGPADQDMEWSEDGRRGHLALPAPAVADRERGRRAARSQGDEVDRPDARRAPDDRARDRRHRPPLPVQHADRGGHGARQRARPLSRGSGRAVRRGDRRLAAAAVCAAHHRGAVVAAGPRAAVGAAVAARRIRRCWSARRSSS